MVGKEELLVGFNLPALIEAVATLIVAVFASVVLIKLGRLIDRYSDKVKGEEK